MKRTLNAELKTVPQNVRNSKEKVYMLAISKASEIKKELSESKEWTLEDGVKAGEWLDGLNWGIKILRDNDPQWKALFESISHYSIDEVLRELFQKHIDFSYAYNSASLALRYSARYPNSILNSMLHATLASSPISPEKAELALGEIKEQITKRIKVKNLGINSDQRPSITVNPVNDSDNFYLRGQEYLVLPVHSRLVFKSLAVTFQIMHLLTTKDVGTKFWQGNENSKWSSR